MLLNWFKLAVWMSFKSGRYSTIGKKKKNVYIIQTYKGNGSESNLNEWKGARAFPFVSNKTLLLNDLSALPV